MSLPFTIYKRPNGQKTEAEMREITPEDEAWYRENNIKVGMEQITEIQMVVYAEYGETGGEPDEITYLVPLGEDCKMTMSKIRRRIEEARG